MTNEALTFQQRSLRQQGYEYDASQLSQLDWGLRFTPIACSTMTLVGLLTANPQILIAVSFLGVWAFLAPAAHPMDLLYNHLVRHLFGAIALPPNPFQRRLACLAAGVMNAGAATLFWLEMPNAARIVGGVLLVLQMIVITTHFCALSWIYDLAAKALGQWEGPVTPEKAQQLLDNGALLVDVREPNEFARGHITGALSIPMSALEHRLEELKGKTCVLYCASGMRSQMATKRLKQFGYTEVYNLGGMARGKDLRR